MHKQKHTICERDKNYLITLLQKNGVTEIESVTKAVDQWYDKIMSIRKPFFYNKK